MFKQVAKISFGCVLGVGGLLGALPLHAAPPVDLELAVLVDISRSVDAKEFSLQRDVYVKAFQDPKLYGEHIAQGQHKRVAVTFVYWSSPDQQVVAVDWRVLDSAESSKKFAEDLLEVTPGNVDLKSQPTPFNGTTAPGSAMAAVYPTFGTNAFDGARKVLVVSGDGAENAGLPTQWVRDEALKNGVTSIHALPIGSVAIGRWFAENVQGGADAFTVPAPDFAGLAAVVPTVLHRAIRGGGN